jgi:hypothetical protein
MVISLERAAMRGRLSEAESRMAALRLQIEGLCLTIRQSLNTALTGVGEIDVPLAAGQMDLLELAWTEMQKTRIDIERLKKELG